MLIKQAQDITKRYKVIARKQTEETAQLVRDFINNTENVRRHLSGAGLQAVLSLWFSGGADSRLCQRRQRGR